MKLDPPSIDTSLSELSYERLNEVRANIKTIDPNTALEIATELSVLLGPILEHEAELRQLAYKVLLLAMEDEKVSHAKAESQMYGSDAYKRYKTATGLYIGVLETIRSLRKKVGRLEDEYQVTK
jgi:hypothetical protein